MRGREKTLKQAGNYQQRHGAGYQPDGFRPGEGKRSFASAIARKEQATCQTKACGTSNEDAGQLKRAVRRDEACEREPKPMLRAHRADDAHLPAVVPQQQERANAEGDAAGEGEKANAYVVGQDEA